MLVCTPKLKTAVIAAAVVCLSSFANVCPAIAIPAPSVERDTKLIKVAQDIKTSFSSPDVFTNGLVLPLGAILENQQLSDTDVLGAIYFALENNGLAFDGSIGLPPNMSYLDFMLNSSNWIAKDAHAGEVKKEARERLLAIIDRTIEQNVLLSSYGLILAASIAPKETAIKLPVILSFESALKGRQAPIVIHNISAASIILSEKNEDTKELSEALAAILPKLSGEEQREDVLSALSVMADESAYKAVFAFWTRLKASTVILITKLQSWR
ncbi:MAG: hypothetical protein K1X83_15040 [Oligoflexia bacterium]|nr:hypothetical protein [Oligoflexia bacterium]